MRRLPALVAILCLALLGALGVLAYVRVAPSGGEWHVDPEAEGRSGPGRWLIADGGDVPALRLSAAPERALAAFDAAAVADGAERLAWDPEAGRATYVARSAVLGFPDYVSVKVAAEGEGSRLAAYSRLRFGSSDFGVNRARLERWAERVRAAVEAG